MCFYSKHKLVRNSRSRHFCRVSLTRLPFPHPQRAFSKLNICNGSVNNSSPKLTHAEEECRLSPYHTSPSSPSFLSTRLVLQNRSVNQVIYEMWVGFFPLKKIRPYCVEKLKTKIKSELMLFP